VADADAICFGGTKNGLMFGEAVLFSPNTLPRLRDTLRLRKTRLQLASKMRYIAAQFREYAKDGLWERNARRANDMAARLASGVARLGLKPSYPVDTNAVFARIPAAVAETLRAKRFFYDWEGGIVRWMASWDTSEADVDGFLVDLEAALGAYRAGRKNLKERGGAEESELSRRLAQGRAFLSSGWKDVDAFISDQALGRPAPPLCIEPAAGQSVVALPEPLASGLGSASFRDITASRKSRRSFGDASLSLEELSFLLWAAAGVKDKEAAGKPGAKVAFRTVPSGGCRHPLELYAYARRVRALSRGSTAIWPRTTAWYWYRRTREPRRTRPSTRPWAGSYGTAPWPSRGPPCPTAASGATRWPRPSSCSWTRAMPASRSTAPARRWA
jgi:hypothetical protein